MEEKILRSITRQFKAVFPGTLNANDTLFGGQALKWMDEVAYITATRYTRKHMFTVSTGSIKFLQRINSDSIIEIIGKVEKITPVRIYVKVEIYAEDMYSSIREKKVEGLFVLVALDEHKNLIRLY